MVADEEKRASRFQQGLKMDVQMYLIPQQLKTYSQVLSIAREVERGLEKKSENQVQNKSVKRPFQLMNEEDAAWTINGPIVKRPFQPSLPQIICNFCHKPGHYRKDCRMANGLCLACGTGSHAIRDCPFRRVGNTTPVRPVLPAPPLRRNPEPVDRRAPFPPQQYDQPQRGPRTRVDHGKGQVYNMSAEASGKATAEYETQYSEQESWGYHYNRYPDLLCFELVIFHKYSTLSFSHCRPWSLLCSSSPYRNCEDAIFVRWVECNTPLPEYVLSCVFRFLDHFFWFTSCIYFVLWIVYMIVLS